MPRLVIRQAGLQTTVQDLGRTGHQALGISPSGAMDPFGMRLANALLGQAQGSPALEFNVLGPTLTVEGDALTLAIVGDCSPTLNSAAITSNRSLKLAEGDELKLGALSSGRYGYIAVAADWLLEPTLGSYATHLGTGIGGVEGRALIDGDVLDFGAPSAPSTPGLAQVTAAKHPDAPLRFVLGPQDDHFAAGQIDRFQAQSFEVSRQSDRQGYRLDGAPVEHLPEKGADITSDGIALGSIQMPANGLPIVLMADRHTMGGYAKLGTVISADLPRLANKRPGETVQFLAFSPSAAIDAARAAEANFKRLCASIAPVRGSGNLTSEQLLQANLISGVVGEI